MENSSGGAADDWRAAAWSGSYDASARQSRRLLRLASGNTSTVCNRLGWIVFALLVVFALGQVFGGVDQQDEGELFTYPWLMAHGYMPYRDIWMMYPPGVFLIITGLVKLGIPGLVAERGISIIARLCYVLLVNRALTRSWTRFSWVGVPMAFSLIFLSSEVRAAPYVVGAPVLLLGLLAARDRLRLSVALFIFAGLLRFEMGLVGIACLATLALLQWSDKARRRQAGLAAVAVVVGLASIYLGLNAVTDGQAIPQIFVYPALIVNPGRRLPLFPPQFGPLGVPIELSLLLGPAFIFVAALRARRPYLAATSGSLYCVVPQFLQRADWEHLCTASAIVAPWLLIAVTDLLTEPVANQGPLSRTQQSPGSYSSRLAKVIRSASIWMTATNGVWPCTLMLAWVVYFSSLSPFSAFHGWNDVVQVNGRTIIAHSATETLDDAQVANFLVRHGSANQRMFVGQGTLQYTKYNPLLLYYLTGIRPATRYLEMNPGVENQASVQREIVRHLRPGDWIVLWKIEVGHEANASSRPGSDLFARWLRDHARPVFENYYFIVLKVTV